jgi:hypothetical protein
MRGMRVIPRNVIRSNARHEIVNQFLVQLKFGFNYVWVYLGNCGN